MAKLKSSLPNMFLSLTLICIAAAGILAGVNHLTTGAIAAGKDAKLESAIKEMVPAFDNSPVKEMYTVTLPAGDTVKIYPAKKGGKLVGVAVESHSMKGFSGEIKVIVGLDPEGKLINYSVLQQVETPGLGSKMDSWFRTDKNKQNIIGKNLASGALKVSKDGGDVDAITAATISSRAFLDAINKAYAAFSRTNTDAVSGATTSTAKENASDGVSSATTSSETKTPATDAVSGATEKGGNNEKH